MVLVTAGVSVSYGSGDDIGKYGAKPSDAALILRMHPMGQDYQCSAAVQVHRDGCAGVARMANRIFSAEKVAPRA